MKSRFAAILLFLAAPLAFAQSPVLEKDSTRAASGQMGSSTAYLIQSAILNQTRRVNIATPPSFEASGPNRHYPVVICFDGEYLFTPKVAAAQYLAAQGQIPEAIIVGIENIGDDNERVHDLTPPGLSVSGSTQNEGGDLFLDFLEKELLPALGRQFRAGQPQVLIGHSSGGILATYAAATRAQSFPFILSIDGPTHLQDGWLRSRLIESARKPAAKNLRYVSMESRFGWDDSSWHYLQAAAPAWWMLYRQKLEHESHNSMPFLATYLGLRQLFLDYSILSVPETPTSASVTHYSQLAGDYGEPPVPPQPLLIRTVEDFVMEGRAADASSALNLLTSGYGEYPGAAQLRAQIAEAAKLPPLTETVEVLLAAPKPDPKTMSQFLGTWSGTIQFNEAPPQPVELRLEVRDGAVAGAWVDWPEPNTELAMPLQYIKVVDGGLDFGFMNGTRPHGMLMHEARLHDGNLQGEIHFRGIRFTYPDGMAPPHISFSLHRKDPATHP